MSSNAAGEGRRVVVVGGGFGGAYCAQVLHRSLPPNWQLTLIDRNNFLLFYPLLVEAGVGSLEPRHVAVPLRNFMPGGDFRMAEVEGIDLKGRRVQYKIPGIEEHRSLGYDHLVLAGGSITRLPEIPGLREHAFEMKGLNDSVLMRDRGIRLLEIANSVEDATLRRGLLRVLVVGSNFTGIEFAGEYQDFMEEARRNYPRVAAGEIEVHLIERGDRILPALDPDLGMYARLRLDARGLKIHTETSVSRVEATQATLTTGDVLETRTVVWCAGIAPSPLLDLIPGLPRNAHGYIETEPTLLVKGLDHVWAIGDSAAIRDPSGQLYGATAQNATRQGVLVARNIVGSLRGREPKPFVYRPIGQLAAIGQRRAVAKLGGFKIAGFLAWFLYRTIYVFKMPGFWHKFRIMADWTVDLAIRAEPVQLGLRRPDANLFDPPGQADKPLGRRG